MNSRILTSLFSVVVVAGAAATGTWAFFHSSTASATTLFGSGSLTIDINDTAKTVPLFDAGAVLPGQSKTGCIAVINKGTDPEIWRAYLDNAADSKGISQYMKVDVTLNPSTGCESTFAELGNTYAIAGPADHVVTTQQAITDLQQPNNILAWYPASGPFNAKTAAVYKVTVTLDPSAPDAVQGDQYSANIKIDATQPENVNFE